MPAIPPEIQALFRRMERHRYELAQNGVVHPDGVRQAIRNALEKHGYTDFDTEAAIEAFRSHYGPRLRELRKIAFAQVGNRSPEHAAALQRLLKDEPEKLEDAVTRAIIAVISSTPKPKDVSMKLPGTVTSKVQAVINDEIKKQKAIRPPVVKVQVADETADLFLQRPGFLKEIFGNGLTREDVLNPRVDTKKLIDQDAMKMLQIASTMHLDKKGNPKYTEMNEIGRIHGMTGQGAKAKIERAARQLAQLYQEEGIVMKTPAGYRRMRRIEAPPVPKISRTLVGPETLTPVPRQHASVTEPKPFEGNDPLRNKGDTKLGNIIWRLRGHEAGRAKELLEEFKEHGTKRFKNVGPRFAPHFEIELHYRAHGNYPAVSDLTPKNKEFMHQIYGGDGIDEETAYRRAVQNHEYHFRKYH